MTNGENFTMRSESRHKNKLSLVTKVGVLTADTCKITSFNNLCLFVRRESANYKRKCSFSKHKHSTSFPQFLIMILGTNRSGSHLWDLM